MTSHQRRLSRLKDLVPDVIGFPAEPWKLVGVRRFEWFRNIEAAAFTNHILLAHLLNVAAEVDDLPVAVAYPTAPGQPLILYRTPGHGDVSKNATWRSFSVWIDSVRLAPGRVEEERRRAEVLDLMRGKQTRPVAIRPLPYDHELGPTGRPPGNNSRTFAQAGGGNRNNVLATNANKWRQRMAAQLAELNEQGFRLVGHKPLALDRDAWGQTRRDDASRKQHSRIKANGGKRRPVGRPRTIGADKERRALELLAAGMGIKQVAKELGTGVSFVQRVRGTAIRPG